MTVSKCYVLNSKSLTVTEALGPYIPLNSILILDAILSPKHKHSLTIIQILATATTDHNPTVTVTSTTKYTTYTTKPVMTTETIYKTYFHNLQVSDEWLPVQTH